MSFSSDNYEVTIPLVTNASALLDCDENKAVLVDVREISEFQEGHYPQAINLPSSQFNLDAYRPFAQKTIYLICHSGNRAKRIGLNLQENGFDDIALVKTQMESLPKSAFRVTKNPKRWTIDRQFRLTLGLLLLLFLVGFTFISTYFIIIPIILCTGLTVTAIIDKCYMRMGIAMLPWNKGLKE